MCTREARPDPRLQVGGRGGGGPARLPHHPHRPDGSPYDPRHPSWSSIIPATPTGPSVIPSAQARPPHHLRHPNWVPIIPAILSAWTYCSLFQGGGSHRLPPTLLPLLPHSIRNLPGPARPQACTDQHAIHSYTSVITYNGVYAVHIRIQTRGFFSKLKNAYIILLPQPPSVAHGDPHPGAGFSPVNRAHLWSLQIPGAPRLLLRVSTGTVGAEGKGSQGEGWRMASLGKD